MLKLKTNSLVAEQGWRGRSMFLNGSFCAPQTDRGVLIRDRAEWKVERKLTMKVDKVLLRNRIERRRTDHQIHNYVTGNCTLERHKLTDRERQMPCDFMYGI